jgi:predicted RNA-binding Zn ribbon-like protein
LEVIQEKVTNDFELVAGHPTLDFVNTLDWRFRESGPEELIPDYDNLLRFATQSTLLTSGEAQILRRSATNRAVTEALRSALELREAAAQILYALMDDAAPPAGAIKKLNHHLQAVQSNRTLIWNNSRLQRSWLSKSDPNLPIWLLAQSASDLLTSDAVSSIRACANPECRWLFLDTSKNHSRRWCVMKVCGNRMKARRFKAQHRA